MGSDMAAHVAKYCDRIELVYNIDSTRLEFAIDIGVTSVDGIAAIDRRAVVDFKLFPIAKPNGLAPVLTGQPA